MENASVRRVRMMNNRPTLLLDGADTLPLIYALSDFPGADSRTYQAQKNIAAFRQAGINLVACDTNLLLGWYKAAEGDYDALRAELSYVLDANPDARIFLRLHLNPPYWWLRDHPDELIVYRTSEGDLPGVDNGDSDRLIRGDKDRLLRVSTASELWRREAGDRLHGFLKSLKNTPEGRALAAVQVAYGLNGEWHQLGTDVGPAMQTAFRRHLRTLYTDEAALQTAWNDPSVTFDTAPFDMRSPARMKNGTAISEKLSCAVRIRCTIMRAGTSPATRVMKAAMAMVKPTGTPRRSKIANEINSTAAIMTPPPSLHPCGTAAAGTHPAHVRP